MMRKIIFVLMIGFATVAMSFKPVKSFKGTWNYQGGVYNGKAEGPPNGYKMQRIYTDHDFVAIASQKGYKAQKYEAGNYMLKGDSCFETSTFSLQASQLIGKKVAYTFTVKNNELVFSGKLPSGMIVEEHWKRSL